MCNGEVYVFDRKRNDALTLRGHDKEGFALSWSPLKSGLLLSAADDAKIFLWDVNVKAEDRVLNTIKTFKINEVPVQDVAWHQENDNLFGSVGDDNQWSSCVYGISDRPSFLNLLLLMRVRLIA